MTAKRWIYPLLLVGVLLLLAAGLVLAEKTNSLSLDWWTVDGGTANLDGGNFSLAGTVGQPDAGSLGGGDYSLSGGYFTPARYSLYLPLMLSD